MVSRKVAHVGWKSVIFSFCLLSPVIAEDDDQLMQLKGLSLEALMDIDVTIAGKTPQKASDIPAAVYVVTQKDIKTMGATSIPEALRMVPGLQVARVDANKWAITIRGFNNVFSNNLLVMIDGRTVYTPLFSGVHWDVQDTVLEDIERIEIIRGPGAAVWGANAVNGVINIITKSAEDTQGTLVAGTLGTEQGIAQVRHGGNLSEDIYYRLYGKYRNGDNGKFADGSKATDGWDEVRGGFRVDWEINTENKLTVQGDLYQGDMGDRVQKPIARPPSFSKPLDSTSEVWGGNVLTRWSQNKTEGASQELQIYFDYSYRDSWLLEVERKTVDLDYRYVFSPWQRHHLVLGAGYRFIDEESPEKSLSKSLAILDPEQRQDHLFSAFLQDDITLLEDTLWLTLGSKFEVNDYSGFEVQPNARLRWKPAQGHLLWGSVSRAVRTPSRVEHNSEIILDKIIQPGVAAAFVGNESFDSEELIAYEVGYRFQPYEHINVDLTAFYNDYDNLRSFTPVGVAAPGKAPVNTFQMKFENNIRGAAYGLEVAVDWQITDKWDLRASYAFLDLQLQHDAHVANKALAEALEGQSPEHQIKLSSSYEITQNLKFNWISRYVDELPTSKVGSHFDIDIGLHWDITKNLNISLFGKNLLHDKRFEHRQTVLAPVPTQAERQGHLAVGLRF